MEADSPFRTVRSLISFFTSFAFSNRFTLILESVFSSIMLLEIERGIRSKLLIYLLLFIFILILSLFIIPSL